MPLTGRCAAPVATRFGSAWFDDAISEDELDRMAGYFNRPDPHLDTLIDRARMPPRDKLRAIYGGWRSSGSPDQMSTVFALRLEGELVGFTNLLRQSPDVNYSHWHILEPEHRAGGLSGTAHRLLLSV